MPLSNLELMQPKIFIVQKGEKVVDHSTVTRWFKKCPSDYKNCENLARSSKPKTLDSEAVLQAIEVNPGSCTRRV